MSHCTISTRRLSTVLAVMLALVPAGHAATVVVNPPTVQNDTETQVTLTVSGLAAGQSVAVDRHVDVNTNGTIDAGEPVVQHFVLTDGQVPLIGGQRNINVPGDDNLAVDGTIQAQFPYPGVASLERIAAPYLYRVSDPSSHESLGTAPFTVLQNTALTQGLHGTITAAGSGQPLQYAMVALIADNLVSGTVTDGSGAYTLYAPPGAYVLIPVSFGYVADFAAGATEVMSSQFTQKNVALTTANLTVSGSVTDEASPGLGLPGLFVLLESSDGFAAGFTDASGNYAARVTPGMWRISPEQENAALLGYVGTRDETQTNVTGDLTRNFTLKKTTALVYGTVQNSLSQPVLGLQMRSHDQSNYEASGRTFGPDGRYAIGVLAGTWRIGPDENDSAAQGYLPQAATLTLQDGQALRHDFTLQALNVTAHVSGRLLRGSPSGEGVTDVHATACQQGQGSCLSTPTGTDGSFELGLFAGTWNVGFSSQELAQQNLVGPVLTVTVVDGVDQTGLVAVALPATAHINGMVQDAQSNRISGLDIFASAMIGGADYYAGSQTDTNGNYSLLVADGSWNVGIDCGDLSVRGYNCAENLPVVINHADEVVNFVVHRPAPTCVGDCGGNQQVTVDEILALVNIALGNASISACSPGDANHSGTITVDEILAAVNNTLNGCPV